MPTGSKSFVRRIRITAEPKKTLLFRPASGSTGYGFGLGKTHFGVYDNARTLRTDAIRRLHN